MNRPGEPWALHFVGMGGVGKTMLIRYLSGAFTAAGGADIVMTRVDFDHISPRYPVEQPGQLLRELAGGLAGHLVEADQVSAYGHFTECADLLDRVTVTTPGRGGVGSAEFENALDAFAALIGAIGKPVVLILDTCEELAKLHPAGEPVPSIERTFEILEWLHEKVPGMRVILAGRRLLAAEYANWRPANGQSPGLVGEPGQTRLPQAVRSSRLHRDGRATVPVAGAASGRRRLTSRTPSCGWPPTAAGSPT